MSTERQNMEMLRKSTTGGVPAAARNIRVDVLFAVTGEPNGGDGGNDAFLDSLSLTLTP